MVKSKSDGVNKSSMIRDILSKTPDLPVKEIVATLAAKGIKVHDPLVYTIRAEMKTNRKANRMQVSQAVAKAGMSSATQLILRVRSLAVEVGGFDELKSLVTVLSE